jgi:hypothetical protein
VTTVRIAHAEPQPGRQVSSEEIDDPRVLAIAARGLFMSGMQVVLADDAGHRALPAWLADDPWATPLSVLLDRPGDGTWATASVPEAFAARLVNEAGGSVTAVEIHPVVPDPAEVSSQTCAARIELCGPAGGGHVMARLDLGLVLALAAGAPVRVPDAVMDRLAVPVPGDDPLAPFGRQPAGWGRKEGIILDGRAGRVLQVGSVLPGQRPRFEPRNTEFRDGLDRWDLDGGLGQDAGPGDYSAAAEGRCAILSSAVPEPGGSAVLVQTVFADDFRGGAAVFRGEVRTEGVAGRAGLHLEILGPDWRVSPGGRTERAVTLTGSQDWSGQQITVQVPEEADIIRFRIALTGGGRVWLRNPELRRASPDAAGSAGPSGPSGPAAGG